jgi:molybdate transport system ATP-binding protein
MPSTNVRESCFNMSIHIKLQIPRDHFMLDVDFTIPNRGITALFGHSGSGKTTILRAIAGLERAKQGEIIVGEETWQSKTIFVPAHRRAVGYVFQNASLLPHLTVRENLNYALKRKHHSEDKVSMAQVIEWFGLSQLLARQPQGLSGGEQQRVALARALLIQPQLVLMDEPLSSLDQKSKQEILPYLMQLHENSSTPMIYVSHDWDEIRQLADTVVMLEAGRIQCQTTVAEYPASVTYCPHCQQAINHFI